jgi:hypothetical protein
MGKRLIDLDPDSGVATYHQYDHATRETTIESVQDAAPFLRVNQAHRNRDTGGGGRLNSISRQQIDDGWWHVACIPIGVQYQWIRDYGVDIFNRDHQDAVKRLLNDPDWAYLRTNPGRV